MYKMRFIPSFLLILALGALPLWAQQPPKTQADEKYQLGPEDLITVLVWKNEALSRQVSVRPDGWISLPLIGDVKAAGLTAMQLKETVAERLKEFVADPNVTVLVDDIRNFKVFIIGEVNRPGAYQLKSDTTVIQALALAGGFTQFASRTKVMVLRKEGGKEERIRFNYNEVASGSDSAKNLLLKPGDTIIVP